MAALARQDMARYVLIKFFTAPRGRMTILTYSDIRAACPQARSLRLAAADLNGIPRAKRKPIPAGNGQVSGRYPYSALNVDILGHDIEGSPLVFDTGDADAELLPTGRIWPMPWLANPAALVPVSMYHQDGTAFAGDPRHALGQAVSRLAAIGYTPVIGVEYEFFLLGDDYRPAAPPGLPARPYAGDVLCLAQLDAFDAYLSDLYEACADMDIPAEVASSESAPGQFEITLGHLNDPMRAADNAWGFKLAAKGIARKHGINACFMAKPDPQVSGSGLHCHISLIDRQGRTVFDDGRASGTPALQHAIAGCLEALPDSTALLAPYPNSFDRFVADAHAPYGVAWGYDNRTVALRVPPGPRRLEHRVAGADANIYLLLAVVLGAMARGLDAGRTPPKPLTGNAYEQPLAEIPRTQPDALSRMEASKILPDLLPPMLIDNFLRTKRQEARDLSALSSSTAQDALITTV